MKLDAAKGILVTSICNFRLAIMLVLGYGLASFSSAVTADEAISLQLDADTEGLRVSTTLKADGHLHVGEGEQQKQLPIRVAGNLEFVQVRKGNAAVRKYEQAEADISVNSKTNKKRLSTTRQLIVAQPAGDEVEIFSPLGPITRGDLELLSTQFDVAALGELVPQERVDVGDTWPVGKAAAAMLLGLDSVEQSELTCKLTRATAEEAALELVGKVEGNALGAATKVAVDGGLTIDRRAGRISQIDVQINETREVGHFAPGFAIEASIRTTVTPAELPAELSTESLQNLAIARTPSNLALDFASSSLRLGFIHDRRWRTTMHRHDLLVMRMVGGGQFIAQCNISPLPSAGEDEAVELAKFRAQVEQTIAEQGGQVEETSKADAENGLSVLRIAASGKANGVLLTYIYYLLTQTDGRRAAIVFTLASAQQEQFATADHDLIGSIQFLQRTDTARLQSEPDPK